MLQKTLSGESSKAAAATSCLSVQCGKDFRLDTDDIVKLSVVSGKSYYENTGYVHGEDQYDVEKETSGAMDAMESTRRT